MRWGSSRYPEVWIIEAFLVDEESLPENQEIEPTARGIRTLKSRSRMNGADQVIEFVISDELFAVDLFDTREVITTPDVTPIPNAPPFITGMIDLRGVITTIIDLRVLIHITWGVHR
jgi:purine-binding chemotaxis protein CheW